MFSAQSPNNALSSSLTRPLCILVLILIGCNLITLHFLNKSVQRTSSMNCATIHAHDIHAAPKEDPSHHMHNEPQKHVPNLLEAVADSPYNHVPYLPHNLKDHINLNPNNLNDPQFIQTIKEHQSFSIEKQYKHKENPLLSDSHMGDNAPNDDTQYHKTYHISQQFVRPSKSITIEDEIDRNHIITNKQLWNIKAGTNNMQCDNTIEYLFNNSIHTLHKLKGRNYIESMICSNTAKMGWRHASYVPFIFGNHCEPWWSRDAIYITSKLLNKNMFGIEYGAGVSSMWLSMLANYTIVMEHDKLWQNGVRDIMQQVEIDNLLILQENLGRRYCELDYSDSFRGNPGKHEWKKGEIDFFAIDGRLRYASTEWMLEWIKPHGGIVIFDNSDRMETGNKYKQYNATNLIPKHWLRFDSAYFKQHVLPIRDRKWLKNSMTTIWITRHEECAQGEYDNVDWSEFKRAGAGLDEESELNFKPF